MTYYFRYSGRIFLTSPLDRETQGNITLRVEASDGVDSASASIEILIGDVNDNEPAFKQLAYFVSFSVKLVNQKKKVVLSMIQYLT